MLIFTKIIDLQEFLNTSRKQGSIGFVPTMGALHAGHQSLVEQSVAENRLTVCSIFVNPTQFNDKADLARYPRTPEPDMALLRAAGCGALFMPEVAEMYPEETHAHYDFGFLGATLEALHRPGHFDGVAQIVSKFFEIIRPSRAYFGKKDYQQLLIVTELARRVHPNITIVPCETKREPDGLAMSSRNRLLNATERKIASHIPEVLKRAVELAKTKGIDIARSSVETELLQWPDTKLEYLEFRDAKTLRPLKDLTQGGIALIALFVGKIRLIDNLQA